MGRLYSSTYYALRDTRTPLRFAIIRVVLTTGLGYLSAVPLPPALGLDQRWGVAGLTASAGIAGWIEFALLRRTLNRRIGQTGAPASLVARLWLAAIAGAGAGWAVKTAIGPRDPMISAAAILPAFGAVYLGATWLLGVPEFRTALRRFIP
jgi:putative peptidoglycan lipid II flippase